MSGHSGQLTLLLFATLEKAGISPVYLRNYEALPQDVGNDVDLLIPHGMLAQSIGIVTAAADKEGWSLAGVAVFAETALYFTEPLTGETLHIDFYEEFRWHFLVYADARSIINRRYWNGLVFVPDPQDELYLNICERLIHGGTIRDKHRKIARDALSRQGQDFIIKPFLNHLGNNGAALAKNLIQQNWEPHPNDQKTIRKLALFRYGFKQPFIFIFAFIAYIWRIGCRLIAPSGRFVVFEGADGVGKSTILESIVPWGAEWCAGRTPYVFHWKPEKLRPWPLAQEASVDPRGKNLRSRPKSLLFLAYHVFGFWKGWILHIYPLLAKSHLVVGDRYSYDLFLDPARFRLDLPTWICKLAAMVVPQPDLAIGLVAQPDVIHARKPELQPEEIASYQKRWMDFSRNRDKVICVSADGTIEEVILRVKQALISRYANKLKIKPEFTP